MAEQGIYFQGEVHEKDSAPVMGGPNGGSATQIIERRT
jgi:hypothetical protein